MLWTQLVNYALPIPLLIKLTKKNKKKTAVGKHNHHE